MCLRGGSYMRQEESGISREDHQILSGALDYKVCTPFRHNKAT